MGKPQRKPRAPLPRKRVIKQAEPEVKPAGAGRESIAVLLGVLGLFLLFSLYSEFSLYKFSLMAFGEEQNGAIAHGYNVMGRVGGSVARILIFLLGWCSFVTVVWSLLLARTVWSTGLPAGAPSVPSLLFSAGASLWMTAFSAAIASVIVGDRAGGLIGTVISHTMVTYVNHAGTILLCSAFVLLSLGVATGIGAGNIVSITARVLSFCQGVAADSWFLISKIAGGSSSLAVRAAGQGAQAVTGKLSNWSLGVPESGGNDQFVLGLEKKQQKRVAKPAASVEEDDIDDELFDDEFEENEDDELEEDEFEDEEEFSQHHSVLEPIISRRLPGTEKKGVAKAAKEEAQLPKVKTPVKFKAFELPPLDLLVRSDIGAQAGPQDQDLISNSRRLETALENFRIGGRVLEVHPGPVVTLYQFEPAAGIKVQRIINLADDLALALKVASVRVYAPVPGKGTVGIEVPNNQREMVRLRDVLEVTESIERSQMPLGLALGKDTYGAPSMADLSKMPHLLIAGATGTGKSVCINSLLLSLVFRNTPDDLRLIMIDPKMLELSVYEDIPHLKAPVVTNPKRARGVLWWAVEEMERRYKLMKTLGVRDLAMYNRSVVERSSAAGNALGSKRRKAPAVIELEEKDVIATGSPFEGLDRSSDASRSAAAPSMLEELPRIVIVVDELADLMLTVGREIEELLTRLAQKARASGIHLILATQRPSVNVITGLIKANFPARISFKVASKIDARTVMDTSGAEKLLGQGDMLFLSPGLGRVQRLHSPFVSDKEVHDVVDWLRRQGAPDYDASIEKMIERMEEAENAGGGEGRFGAGGGDEYDEFYDQAVRLVVDKGQASTSMVQRAFRIGYNRAARILEIMERDGVVGPADGAKPRQVLVCPDI